MKITYLKSGKYSFNPVNGPVITCLKGHSDEMPENSAKQLIADKWAEPFDNVVPPWESDDWDSNSPNAKDLLEKYSLQKYKLNIDKRKTIPNIIKSIKKVGNYYAR